MHIGKAPTFRRLSRVIFIQQILNEELRRQVLTLSGTGSESKKDAHL